ncbi:MAG: AAA family ATPase, partial [Sphaerochaetaceae bacterium]|nr:AAA family ATPase [Sphaerochaetaceae bacterium]
MTEARQSISTTISSFQELRENGVLYVDKTSYLAALVMGADKLYFLSRPRRFGKSLTVSTLEAIFQGKRELFKGLAIDALDYDWKKYPIIHIDFTNCWKKTADALDG